MNKARFVGIGVSEYDMGHTPLGPAVPNVEGFANLLKEPFESTVLASPDERVARDYLRQLRGSMPEGGSLVLMWTGRAILSPVGGVRLLARDSWDGDTDGLGVASDVAKLCAESGASQLLLLIDVCFLGMVEPAGMVATNILRVAPAEAHAWAGVLVSCLPYKAWDGLFGRRLIKTLADGPDTLEVRARWSPRTAFIRGDDLCDAVVKEWDTAAESPTFLSKGSAWEMFPNPLYKSGGPPLGHVFISYVREDLLYVDRLQQVLETAGMRVWRDTADLWPGEDWRAKIRQAITNDALVFLPCFSRNSLARKVSYQNEELVLAIEQLRLRRPGEPWLIPVRFDDIDIPDFDIGGGRTLTSIQRADLFGDSYDLNAARLIEAMQRILGPPIEIGT